jgi:aspartyl-tRNA(Asn)/glutamyl-tRNA(Gln) amidotransferase subunit C
MTHDDAPQAIQEDEVLAIAQLAHLRLSDGELERMTRELGSILAYMQELRALDVEGVAPTAHVQLSRLPLRADDQAPSLPQELALREAPEVLDGGFAVPAFVDEG